MHAKGYLHRNTAITRVQSWSRGKDAMRLTQCEAPACETRPDHNTGNYVR